MPVEFSKGYIETQKKKLKEIEKTLSPDAITIVKILREMYLKHTKSIHMDNDAKSN